MWPERHRNKISFKALADSRNVGDNLHGFEILLPAIAEFISSPLISGGDELS